MIKRGNQITLEISTGQVEVVEAPARLRCSALGSCVAVALYDSVNKVGGLAHVMLPSTDFYLRGDDPLKYADCAIDELLAKLSDVNCKMLARQSLGAGGSNVRAKLAGGGMLVPDALDVGSQNIVAVKEKLAKHGIPVAGEMLGGTVRRSVIFDLADGTVWCSEDGGVAVNM